MAVLSNSNHYPVLTIAGKMNAAPGRLMLMDRIQWRGGWPVVGVPSDTPRPGPRVAASPNTRPAPSLSLARRPFHNLAMTRRFCLTTTFLPS